MQRALMRQKSLGDRTGANTKAQLHDEADGRCATRRFEYPVQTAELILILQQTTDEAYVQTGLQRHIDR